jgi:DNA helicase II / ATP-dependent DNA helicase PcrA
MNTTTLPTSTAPARLYSVFQQAIFSDVQEGEGHTIVSAKPGSGKSTTMLASLDHLPMKNGKRPKVIILAFSNKIRDEMKLKAPKWVNVMGMNSLGMRLCLERIGRTIQVDEGKVSSILVDLLQGQLPRYLAAIKAEAESETNPDEREIAFEAYRDERKHYLRTANKIVSLCKATLAMKVEEIGAMIDDRGIDLPSRDEDDGGNHAEVDRQEMIRICRRTLELCYQERTKSIDFDDQLWLPIVLKMEFPQYDYVLVDEVQDLSAVQIQMILRSCAPGGRIIAVGDERQCIFAFRGADYRTMARVKEALSAKVLPLSVCYRCATSIVREAKTIVADIEAAPGAPEGVVRHTALDKVGAEVQPGDFILSRTNAPLMELCMELLRQGRPAVIAGVDVTEKFESMILRSRAKDVEELLAWVESWLEREVERLEKKNIDPKRAEDLAACMRVLCEDVQTLGQVRARMKSMFADKASDSMIVLSSTHRAKGLEKDRAFLLRWTFCAGKEDQTEAERIEEENLLYVAITRARKELVYVTERQEENSK